MLNAKGGGGKKGDKERSGGGLREGSFERTL